MKSRGDRVTALESELRSELAGERTRHKHAAGRDEAGRFTERRVADIAIHDTHKKICTMHLTTLNGLNFYLIH